MSNIYKVRIVDKVGGYGRDVGYATGDVKTIQEYFLADLDPEQAAVSVQPINTTFITLPMLEEKMALIEERNKLTTRLNEVKERLKGMQS